jgi:hypothetical protein
MSSTLKVTAVGISPAFQITAEELLHRYRGIPTPTATGDWVKPPDFGENGGPSLAMQLLNVWFPWIDEKLIQPKYDGVCNYLGIASNRPTYIKDYHMIALNRAVDRLLAPNYTGVIVASVVGVGPTPPPTE